MVNEKKPGAITAQAFLFTIFTVGYVSLYSTFTQKKIFPLSHRDNFKSNPTNLPSFIG
jgi:hypothetical protein